MSTISMKQLHKQRYRMFHKIIKMNSSNKKHPKIDKSNVTIWFAMEKFSINNWANNTSLIEHSTVHRCWFKLTGTSKYKYSTLLNKDQLYAMILRFLILKVQEKWKLKKRFMRKKLLSNSAFLQAFSCKLLLDWLNQEFNIFELWQANKINLLLKKVNISNNNKCP